MRLSVPLSVVALLASAAVFAQEPPPSSAGSPNTTAPPSAAPDASATAQTAPSADLGAVFDKLNTSHTGKLTRDEAQAHPTVAANFDAADANKDGVVSKDEFMAAFRSQ